MQLRLREWPGIWAALLVVCLATVPAVAESADDPTANWIRNGSFEEKTADGMPVAWTLGKGRLASDASRGRTSAEFMDAIGQWSLRVPPGEYVLRFMLRKGCPNVLGVSLFCHDGAGNEIENARLKAYVAQGKLFTDWQPFEFKVNVPANAVRSAVVFHPHGGLMLIDDVRLTADRPDSAGELVFQDDFERAEIGPDWKAESGGWRIVEGALFAPVKISEAIIKVARPLGHNLRLEYTCWSDSPCDLSALLGADPAKPGLHGYSFGFGAAYNSYNFIAKSPPHEILNRTLQEGFNTGIQPGKKHRVVVSAVDGKLSYSIDGRSELNADDPFPDDVAGDSVGLFTWNLAYFDDVKVYRLPETQRAPNPPERKVEEVKLHDFSTDTDVTGTNAVVVKLPTWEYADTPDMAQITVDDPCLKAESAQFELPTVETGIVELDVFSEVLQEIRIELVAGNRDSLGGLVIGRDGFYYAEGADGRVRLTDKIQYPRRQLYDDLRFAPGQWHTLRIKYDLKDRLLDNLAVIDHYTEMKGPYSRRGPGGYLSLGGRVPLKAGGNAAYLAIHGSSRQPIFADNVLMFGPVGARTVNGKPIIASGRQLLDLAFQQRRDPISLKTQSFRLLTKKHHSYQTPTLQRYRDGGGKQAFQKMASRYNELMLRSAFLRERIELLERTAYYREDAGLKVAGAAQRTAFEESEKLQEQAVKEFANALWHDSDEVLLATRAAAAMAAYEQAVSAQENALAAGFGANATPVPAAPIRHTWRFEYDPTIKKWRRNGNVEANFIVGGPGSWTDVAAAHWVVEKTQMLGFQPTLADGNWTICGTLGDGDYFDAGRLERSVQQAQQLRQEYGLPPNSCGFLNHASNDTRDSAPKWWLDAHDADPDIFHYLPDGTPGKDKTDFYRGWPTFPTCSLNFWNPAVREYFKQRFSRLGAAMKEHRDVFGTPNLYFGGEAHPHLKNGLKMGYAPSAARAFQEHLRAKFGQLEQLNQAWGTDYADFAAITPPRDFGNPSGLQYEFNTFVNRQLFELMIRDATADLERGFGQPLPVAHDFQDTFGPFDMPAFFDSVSLVLFHSYQIWDRKIYPKWLESLSQATQVPWGAREWISSQGCKTMFDCDQVRLNGLRELSHQLMWGCAAPNMYSRVNRDPGAWQYTLPAMDFRVADLLFDYNISYYRIAKDRGIRFGGPALTAPVAPPDVAVLEVDSSRRNAPPQNAVYTMCRCFAAEMEEHRVHYGFLFERLLLDGRQALDGVQMLFVPNGICMSEELDRLLEDYVAKGGVIVAFAPPGVFSEIGKPKSGMLDKAFPGAVWSHANFQKWTATNVHPHGQGAGACYTGSIGAGTLHVFAVANDWGGPREAILRILKESLAPRITNSQADFQYCLREQGEMKYLYVLNHSIDAPREGTFTVAGKYRVTDVSLPQPMDVLCTREGARTAFNIRLSMSEMALLEMRPAE